MKPPNYRKIVTDLEKNRCGKCDHSVTDNDGFCCFVHKYIIIKLGDPVIYEYDNVCDDFKEINNGTK